MHRLVLLTTLVTLASGCSFLRANCANDPATGCSVKTQAVDYVVAGAAAAGATLAYVLPHCDLEDCPQQDYVMYVSVPALVVGVAALASAIYGGSVTDRCERLTTTSSSRPASSPAASAP